MSALRQRDLWAAEVLNWQQLKEHEAARQLVMEQVVGMNGSSIVTTRCPLKLNGHTLTSNRPAPALWVNTKEIISQLINGSATTINKEKELQKEETGLLSNLLVDFSQFLSGPYATLRLADLCGPK